MSVRIGEIKILCDYKGFNCNYLYFELDGIEYIISYINGNIQYELDRFDKNNIIYSINNGYENSFVQELRHIAKLQLILEMENDKVK
jgi:hypothetical protein